jgi:hypothetical protein
MPNKEEISVAWSVLNDNSKNIPTRCKSNSDPSNFFRPPLKVAAAQQVP